MICTLSERIIRWLKDCLRKWNQKVAFEPECRSAVAAVSIPVSSPLSDEVVIGHERGTVFSLKKVVPRKFTPFA